MTMFAFFTLLLILFYLLGFVRKPSFDWMDRDYTAAIKGLSILTILWVHSGAQLSIDNIQFVGGIGVSLFLICSGYGLEVSYEKIGLNKFWLKRVFNICIPFWIIELAGLLFSDRFTLSKYIVDAIFVSPATAYGWFMQYIIICYFLFYLSKCVVMGDKSQTLLLLIAFAIWFIVESSLLANPNMPFLRARQMLCFPFGVFLAQKKDRIKNILTPIISFVLLFLSGICCVVFMLLTQLAAIKSIPFLISNTMALLTCFPVAIGILFFGNQFKLLFKNRFLIFTGTISYEIYLVHTFTLDIIKHNFISILLFSGVTYALAYVTYNIFTRLRLRLFAER